jgi:hypothetical protein
MATAKAIGTVDTFDQNIPGRATFTAAFSVVGNSVTTPVSKNVKLHGPGDVANIDVRQVIRTEPKPLTPNYEPNFFAAVEFDRPDFPWIVTPARETVLIPDVTDPAVASARLRPWLALVAVRQQEGVSLTMPDGAGLPVLEIRSPAAVATELQDLSDSWAWAHAQTVGEMGEAEGVLQDGPPEHNCSRLICPHRLLPQSAYIACVVPAFKLGVMAGLGIPITAADETKLEPAWLQDDDSVRLPVYFHFEFNTGPNGDFESLASLLVPRSLTADDVTVPFDISSTGDTRLPDTDLIRLDGALTAGDPPAFDDTEYQAALAEIVSQPEPTLDPDDPDPVIAPPLYGRWHAARQTVTPGATWLADLNLDPRRRVAASAGTQVVQRNQEDLMAAAWDQLGEVQKANEMLRRAQLAREAMKASYSRTVAAFSTTNQDRGFAFTGPVLSRVVDAGQTIAAAITQSRVPDGLVSPAFRRLTRPRGAVGARLVASMGSGTVPSIIESISASVFNVIPFKTNSGQVDGNTTHPDDTIPVFGNPGDVLPTDGGALSDPNVPANAFRDAAATFQSFFGGTGGPPPVIPASNRPALNLGLGSTARDGIQPATAITSRVLARLTVNGGPLTRATLDPLEPVMAAPQFPQPMYAPLRDLSPDNLLPGVFRIPPNTVTLLNTNRAFVEAYMAGLNHEMARELLWRGYPTDQRGTYFAQFWDPTCRVPPATTPAEIVARRDITPMHTWPLSTRLGTHQPADPGRTSGNQVVFIIRGELLRRYPNAIIYAAPGTTDTDGNFDLDETQEEVPIFRGTLPPDITFLGFNLTDDDVRTRELYFVLQEQPTEPRFGLNEAPPTPIDPNAPLAKWEDLSWGHFGPNTQFIHVGTLPAASSLPNNPIWGVNSAHLAQITFQTPFRVAIYGPDILPTP